MGFNYEMSLEGTQALHFIRRLVGDVHKTTHHLENESIEVILLQYGLTVKSDPITNRRGVLKSAADCAEMIAAVLAREAEIVVTNVGAVKSSASSEYRQLAKRLRERAGRGAGALTGVTRGDFALAYIEGIDALPAETC